MHAWSLSTTDKLRRAEKTNPVWPLSWSEERPPLVRFFSGGFLSAITLHEEVIQRTAWAHITSEWFGLKIVTKRSYEQERRDGTEHSLNRWIVFVQHSLIISGLMWGLTSGTHGNGHGLHQQGRSSPWRLAAYGTGWHTSQEVLAISWRWHRIC
jgi:hypothetical protein